MSSPITVTTKPPETTAKRKLGKLAVHEAMWGYIFILPVVLGLGLFYMAPSAASLFLSFTSWDGLTAPQFIGLDNFANLMKDDKFTGSMLNTMLYTIGTVPLSVALATVLAVLLNQKIKGMVFYRTFYFIPVITMPIAVGMVWKWLYNSEFGLINHVLGVMNLPQPNWLFDEKFALFSIVLVSVWSSIGYNAVILLSGLQGISGSYYEAASLDGAGTLYKFFRITLPLLTPSLFFVLVMSFINSFQVFDLIFIMMDQQTTMLESTRTVVYSIWEDGFKYFNMGYASAQAFILFVVILIITMVQMYIQKRWVHYQ
ncbi:sugar ABC transporter permease [Paenibacillus lautus]|uniref:Sugar ABC transporter permease n=1 Tax=Paenibacillus lautus TaxID=1401 RepID=A0A385TL60_PAELA|nr:sugar ABC transporter permease [Paenibacillus lautus]AYB43372.1 sugar ABC transporter permease [Paenibacillus lautus]MBY0160032.1 sugar ABC transporter permease [Cytobacillus firmus]